MREILFRGKPISNEHKWVYGDYCDLNKGRSVLSFKVFAGPFIGTPSTMYAVIPETVGQYTGLKDNNGKKIYEGDIIKSKQDGMIGVIRFGEYQTTNSENGESHLGFNIEWHGKYSDLLRKDLGWWINLKIIGNIYDNPELLEGEHNG